MIMGARSSQAIGAGAIFVGFDMQLDLLTQHADANTRSHVSNFDKAYSLSRCLRSDVV
ncbi:hypothetical protein [Bradyrhizobium sp. RDM4]|uniref:hypothetical protein n=1 Tax=Bradyrhizobium sp. RDM4 TaxID=3378765 RepID=UPI0038FCFC5F